MQIKPSHSAFTLLEVLVVVSIIGLLVSLLLPALTSARQQAYVVQCASNVRQLVAALHMYSIDNHGRLLPTRARWYESAVIGPYLGNQLDPTDSHDFGFGDSIFVCPADLPFTRRSYSPNGWAEMPLDHLSTTQYEKSHNGEFFDASAPGISDLLLMTEAVSASTFRDEDGIRYFMTSGTLGTGSEGVTPGMNFSYHPTPPHNLVSRYGVGVTLPNRLDYVRHGRNGDYSKPEGALNIGYADGHVSFKKHTDLYYHGSDGIARSTFDTLWSPVDRKVELPP